MSDESKQQQQPSSIGKESSGSGSIIRGNEQKSYVQLNTGNGRPPVFPSMQTNPNAGAQPTSTSQGSNDSGSTSSGSSGSAAQTPSASTSE